LALGLIRNELPPHRLWQGGGIRGQYAAQGTDSGQLAGGGAEQDGRGVVGGVGRGDDDDVGRQGPIPADDYVISFG
jgi:hypothetical protein